VSRKFVVYCERRAGFMNLVSRPLLLMLWAAPSSACRLNRGDKPQHLGFLWQNRIAVPSGCAPRAANSWRGTIIPKKPKCLNASATRRCRLRRGAARRGMRLFNFTCDRAAVKLLVDERETSRAHNVAKDNMPAVLSRFQCSFATAPTNRCWWMMLYANM
jgi:hypothetical protein